MLGQSVYTCIRLTSAVMIHTFRIPVTDTATTVSSAAHTHFLNNWITQTTIRSVLKHCVCVCTLGAMRADDAHGADPVRRYFGHQRVKDFQTGGIHDEDLWVVTMTQETSLTLGANGELIKLCKGEQR